MNSSVRAKLRLIQGDGTPFYHQLTNRGEGLRSQEQKEQGKVRES